MLAKLYLKESLFKRVLLKINTNSKYDKSTIMSFSPYGDKYILTKSSIYLEHTYNISERVISVAGIKCTHGSCKVHLK